MCYHGNLKNTWDSRKFDCSIIGFRLPYLSEINVEKLRADANKLLLAGAFISLNFFDGDPKKKSFQF